MICLSLHSCLVWADSFTLKGCYTKQTLSSLSLISKGEYMYQSSSHCSTECAGSTFFALTELNLCYCGDSKDILQLSASDSSKCNAICDGWADENCGDESGSFLNVYINDNIKNLVVSSANSNIINGNDVSSSSTKNSVSKTTTSILSPSTPSTTISASKTTTTSLSSPTTTTNTTTMTSSNKIIPAISSSPSTITTPTTASTTASTTTSTTPTSTTTTPSSTSSTVSSTSKMTKTTTGKSSVPTIQFISSYKYTTKIVTKAVVSTSDAAQKTIVITATSIVQTQVSTMIPSNEASLYALNNYKATTANKKSISGGAIAGIVIGIIFGFIIILLLIFGIVLYTRKQRRERELNDIEETKQYQPYSFGDENATPVIIPTNQMNSKSSWRLPSRTSTKNNDYNNDNNSKFHSAKRNVSMNSSITLNTNYHNTPNNNNYNGNNSNNNSIFEYDNENNDINIRNKLPSTVFEEPPDLSQFDNNGNQRFSTSSLPDMMEQRPLRIVNPDKDEFFINNDSLDDENTTTSTFDEKH